MSASVAGAAWLAEPALQTLLSVLSQGGETARVAGGAVRNTLLGEPVGDVDIATTNLPDETVRRAEAAGFRAVPTGIEHGTVTVVADGRGYEVTTLRADIETDGRRARVVFGRDWKADAERRDFTVNALYADADGTVHDLVGGLVDIASRTLRFIGDPEARIREDYLRILRFFRFFAWYGSGRPDAQGLKACARLKDGLARLSAERVWAELRKLLSAPDPGRAALWMRQAGVLTLVLPESEKWGIDALPGLIAAEKALGWAPDAMTRIAAIVPPDTQRMKALGERLKMSKAETSRLVDWASADAARPERSDAALARELYRRGVDGARDRLRLALASTREKAGNDAEAMKEAAGLGRQLKYLEGWSKPRFPLSGRDLEQVGVPAGPKMGEMLKALEALWVEGGFAVDRDALLQRAAEMAKD
ncbi:MAG: CCA tRNA nucleotidyltransferase [Rhizobiaceae bacterium]|nr:CCA tRNA nucleotidyltransferase [Rhizobiaceae bacterium]